MTVGERDRGNTRSHRRNEWVLYVHLTNGFVGASMLALTLPDGTEVCVSLTAAYTRVLWAMVKAREADTRAGRMPNLRGWRKAGRLGEYVEYLSPHADTLEHETVVQYVSRIRRGIRTACAAQGVDLAEGDIIETSRGWGYRLTLDIERVNYDELNDEEEDERNVA